jgi:pimeloyl-ACP methyl ester carboxylesterase
MGKTAPCWQARRTPAVAAVVAWLDGAVRIDWALLAMAGDHDGVSLEDTAEIFRDLPNDQLMIVPASKHGTFRLRPGLVNLAMREFLDPPDDGAVRH